MKKCIALVLALVMALSLCTVAMAKPTPECTNHNYALVKRDPNRDPNQKDPTTVTVRCTNGGCKAALTATLTYDTNGAKLVPDNQNDGYDWSQIKIQYVNRGKQADKDHYKLIVVEGEQNKLTAKYAFINAEVKEVNKDFCMEHDNYLELDACRATVTFDAGVGTFAEGKTTPVTVFKGSNGITAPAVKAPADTCYIFDGWYNGETKCDLTAVDVNNNMTLTAKWTQGHTFVKNGDAYECTQCGKCTGANERLTVAKGENNVETPDATAWIDRAAVVSALQAKTSANAVIMDIKLQQSTDGGDNWETVPVTNTTSVVIPWADLGLTYAAALNKNFTIAHAMSNGSIETCNYNVTENGLQITASGLSPFAISWTDKTVYHGTYTPSGRTFITDLNGITVVKVDGKVVDSRYYTISGTNVTLSDAFVNTLANGTHKFTAENATHIASGTFVVDRGTVEAPKTADAGIALYAVMAISSAIGMGYMGKKKEF